ncbi:peptidase CtpA [Candidatus Termititenax dinenymphae]|uniref:Peptidase CtpA n=1 Tax=Candidatus Termititenax dinenymphae TaxID=2218523 RepID=A0A388TJP1_9BACT|nr:peptidase CtpA [Candidatus Termititenax dinenymphae]
MSTKKLRLSTAIILCVITFVLGVSVQLLTAARTDVTWGLLYQVLGIVRTQYVDLDVKDDKLIYGAIRGMLKSLDDPYTRFVDPEGYSEMQNHLNGNFAGVGIQIGMKDGGLTVIAPIEDTPADKAGLKTNDKILEINGKSTEDMPLDQAVSLIRGPRNTKVKLLIQRNNMQEKPEEYTLVRDIIKIKSVNRKKMLDNKNKIGYVMLTTFESKATYDELMEAIKELEQQGLKSLILDLRNNGGGLLDEAIAISSMFVKNGEIVHTVDRYGNKETFQTVEVDYQWYTKPLVVLINGGSASASEILAGAIADNNRGKLIGTQSFGKASVQNIRPLSDGSAILVTVAKYLTPNGNYINKVGISPNYVVEIPTASIEEALRDPNYKYSEEKDVQLQYALDYLRKNNK